HARVLTDRADDPERNSDQHGKAERQRRKLGGDRNARHNLIERGPLGYIGIAEIAVREPADPRDVLDDNRLIEAKLRLDLRLFPRINVAGCVVKYIDDIAGHHPQQDEDDHRYPEQRQEHQKETPDEISAQGSILSSAPQPIEFGARRGWLGKSPWFRD